MTDRMHGRRLVIRHVLGEPIMKDWDSTCVKAHSHLMISISLNRDSKTGMSKRAHTRAEGSTNRILEACSISGLVVLKRLACLPPATFALFLVQRSCYHEGVLYDTQSGVEYLLGSGFSSVDKETLVEIRLCYQVWSLALSVRPIWAR